VPTTTVAVDSASNLYVTDFFNNRMVKLVAACGVTQSRRFPGPNEAVAHATAEIPASNRPPTRGIFRGAKERDDSPTGR
jgi:hypothetical protein